MNKFKVYYSAFIVLVFLFGCMPKAAKYYKQAEEHYTQKEYEFAIQKYQQALSSGGDSAEINYKIAESYRRSNRLQEAEPYYSKAVAAKVDEEAAYFYDGLALKSIGNYEGAAARLKDYLKIGSNFDLINRAKLELNNLKVLSSVMNRKAYYTIANVGDLNTADAEYSPVIFNKKLYFTSNRGAQKMHAATNTGFTDIYEYTFDGTGPYTGQAKALPENINTIDAHEASATFSKDGKYMYFAKAYNGSRKAGEEVDIYVSEMQADGNWGDPVKLPFNDDKAWDSNPWLSDDGKTLYFSSNREGGFGNNDIYKVAKDASGAWTIVTNLGTPINTRGNDMFPYETPSKTFYFSSDGHPSLGGIDLFVVKRDSTKKLMIENMGTPINSSYDDFAIFFRDTLNGFLTSNRPGGKGDDDLYEFKYKIPECKYYVDGSVWGKDGNGPEYPLANAIVYIIKEGGDTTKILETDSKGLFPRVEILPDTKYTIYAAKEGYLKEFVETSIAKVPYESLKPGYNEFQQTVDLKLVLPKKVENLVITIDNIYYDFDKWNIRADAAIELYKVVELLRDNPDISIELGSHTDERGSATYNRNLAQKRAQSAVDFIVSKGIDKSRIVAKGYGEDSPFIKNAQTEEDHQRNRRTTIRVTKIDPTKNLIIKHLNQENQEEILDQLK